MVRGSTVFRQQPPARLSYNEQGKGDGMKKILRNIRIGFWGVGTVAQFCIGAQASSVPGEIIFHEDGLGPAWEAFCLVLSAVWKDAAALAVAFLCMMCMFRAARKQKKRNR